MLNNIFRLWSPTRSNCYQVIPIVNYKAESLRLLVCFIRSVRDYPVRQSCRSVFQTIESVCTHETSQVTVLFYSFHRRYEAKGPEVVLFASFDFGTNHRPCGPGCRSVFLTD